MTTVYHVSMPVCNQHHTTVVVRRGKEASWVEFRGDGLNQWDDDYKFKSPAQRVHDCLEGWHACVLHTGDTLAVLPHHPDYAAVKAYFDGAEEITEFIKYR